MAAEQRLLTKVSGLRVLILLIAELVYVVGKEEKKKRGQWAFSHNVHAAVTVLNITWNLHPPSIFMNKI